MNDARSSALRGITSLVLVLTSCSPEVGTGSDAPAGSGGALAPSIGGADSGGASGSGTTGAGGAPSGGAGGIAGSAGSFAASGGQPAAGSSGGGGVAGGAPPEGPVTLDLIEKVIFYDGYAAKVEEPVPAGVVRLDNSLVTTRLTAETLALIQPHLELDVTLGARCDNYDRIGAVRLALVEKGASSYEPAVTPHVELGRFITPFMDKNAQPDTVPYSWEIDHVAAILRSPALVAKYDFWLELSVFGVPYAANEEVPGCAGRSDVFEGSVSLRSDNTVPHRDVDVLLPLAFNAPFNDYQAGASDQLGVTKKTLTFELDDVLSSGEVVFIVSQHGANSGGEEYVRRRHLVRLDGELALEFTPGRESCEPFRKYNTQGNGIYGPGPRSEAEWQSFSNWCPGDVIDIRRIPLESLSAGSHSLVFEVPEAVFTGNEGNFPLSVFLIGQSEGS